MAEKMKNPEMDAWAEKCFACRFNGEFNPDWLFLPDCGELVCENPRVFTLFSERVGERCNINMIEHQAAASVLHMNRGVDLGIALGVICKTTFWERKLSLKERIFGRRK